MFWKMQNNDKKKKEKKLEEEGEKKEEIRKRNQMRTLTFWTRRTSDIPGLPSGGMKRVHKDYKLEKAKFKLITAFITDQEK